MVEQEQRPALDGRIARSEASRELERRYSAGDPAAFEQVVRLYSDDLHRLIRRLLNWRSQRGEADDLLQDVWVSALASAGRFRGDCSLRTWLVRIAVNHCRGRMRWRAVRERLPAWFLGGESVSPPADALLEVDEEALRIRRAMAQLRHRDREVLVMHYLEEMPATAMAEALGMKRNAVDVALARARKRLREVLEARDESGG